MIDNKTPHLQLPLPHASNLLEEDVLRLRAALLALDTMLASDDPGMASFGALVAAVKATQEALTAALSAHDAQLDAHPPLCTRIATLEAEVPAARIPLAHAASHAPGSGDPLTVFAGLITENVQNLGDISGTVTVDLNAGHYLIARMVGATTLTFSGQAAQGCTTVLLELTNGGQYVVQWGMVPKWSNGIAPVLTASGTDLLALCSQGAGWMGMLVGSNIK